MTQQAGHQPVGRFIQWQDVAAARGNPDRGPWRAGWNEKTHPRHQDTRNWIQTQSTTS